MKKIIALLLILSLVLAFATGCGAKKNEKLIVIGASATPHAEILEQIKPALAEQGYELEIRIFDDYVLPNTALNDGELDANYFQHTPIWTASMPKTAPSSPLPSPSTMSPSASTATVFPTSPSWLPALPF